MNKTQLQNILLEEDREEDLLTAALERQKTNLQSLEERRRTTKLNDADNMGNEDIEEEYSKTKQMFNDIQALVAEEGKHKNQVQQLMASAAVDESNSQYEKIGEVLFNGRDQQWALQGAFNKVEETGGSFDWAFNHPRITDGGCHWTFNVTRAAEYTKGDCEFKFVFSYFTGWNQNEGDCKIDIHMNGTDYLKNHPVKPERFGRQEDEFFVTKDKFNYPDCPVQLKLCFGSRSNLCLNYIRVYVKQV